MLELRPNCELCDKDLPPDSQKAYICSYECTFCFSCVEEVLNNVCQMAEVDSLFARFDP